MSRFTFSRKGMLVLIALMSCHLITAQITDANGIVYVKATATGTGSGDSWANATDDLQAAIDAFDAQQVFVAVGTYHVTSSSFVMKNGVAIYGGFDPDNGIDDLTDARILPDPDNDTGSVLDGRHERPVFWNVHSYLDPMDNTAMLDGFTLINGFHEYYGGAFYNLYAAPVLRNLVIKDCTSSLNGGAINNENSSPYIINCTIKDNYAERGGAIFNSYAGSHPVLINVVITGNTAENGASIYTVDANVTLINVTIAKNSNALYTGGHYASTLKNCIVYGGIEGAYTPQYSLIEGSTDTANGNLYGLGVAISSVFNNPDAGDFRLLNNSVAINTGNNALYPAPGPSSSTLDLAGNPRIYQPENAGVIDMGAYERNYEPGAPDIYDTVFVKTNATGTGVGNSWANATNNLQGAIDTEGIKQVYVATGTYDVSEHSFIMKNGVAIYGGFDPDNGIDDLTDARILPDPDNDTGSILNGRNERPVIWNVYTSEAPMDNTAVLDGFTVTAGTHSLGGGFHNVYASPVLRNLVIRGNSADANGAGLYNEYSSPVLSNCTIKGNTASQDGGGMFNIHPASVPVLTNVALVENTAVSGAAIYNSGAASMLHNVTIVGNSPDAIDTNGGSATLSNSIVYGGIDGSYVAQYSLIEGDSGTENGNIDSAGIVLTDVFADTDAGDYTLLNPSPAIDTGNNALYAGLDENTKDLAGNPRLYGATIDLGAYELQSLLSDCTMISIWNGFTWSNGEPGPDAKAIINGPLALASTMVACELEVTQSGSLEISSGSILTVNGKVINNAAPEDFVVENGGILIQQNDVQNEGPITVEINSYPLYRSDYTLWSSPVAEQNLRNFSPQTLSNRFYSYDTALGTEGEYVQDIFTTDDVQNKIFEPARGYLIRMPNNWTEFTDDAIPGTSYPGVFRGTLNNGTISVPLSTVNTGANLLGNPYPSPISITAFLEGNPDIEQTVYFWRKRNGVAGSGYATYTALGLVSSQEVNGLDLEDVINPGQGFFIRSAAAILNFSNDMRSGHHSGLLLRTNDQNSKHRIWLSLSNSTDIIGQTLIGYVEEATGSIDNGWDGAYFNDSPIALTSLLDGREYSIQALGLPFEPAGLIPLGFKTDIPGTYSISLSGLTGLFAGNQDIFLKDNLTGQIHNLKTSDYSFTSGVGVFNERFAIVYQMPLSIKNPEIKDTVVYRQDNELHIVTGGVPMIRVELFDTCGRLIYTLDATSQTTATISNLNISNQVLLVRISSVDNNVTTKRVIY